MLPQCEFFVYFLDTNKDTMLQVADSELGKEMEASASNQPSRLFFDYSASRSFRNRCWNNEYFQPQVCGLELGACPRGLVCSVSSVPSVNVCCKMPSSSAPKVHSIVQPVPRSNYPICSNGKTPYYDPGKFRYSSFFFCFLPNLSALPKFVDVDVNKKYSTPGEFQQKMLFFDSQMVIIWPSFRFHRGFNNFGRLSRKKEGTFF